MLTVSEIRLPARRPSPMMNQRNCPFCKIPAVKGCEHLALAAEGRDFVRRCIELCQGQRAWGTLCQQRQQRQCRGGWASDQEDFPGLGNAFCDEFLCHLTLFGGMGPE